MAIELDELSQQAPIDRVEISGTTTGRGGERADVRTYTALRLNDDMFALVAGFGRWRSRFGGLSNLDLHRDALGNPVLRWRENWRLTYQEFRLLGPDGVSERLYFYGIDQATGVMFLGLNQPPDAADFKPTVSGTLPTFGLDDEIFVVDYLSEPFERGDRWIGDHSQC